MKRVFGLFKAAIANWTSDNAPRLGAALAYYTVFSISPLLLIVIGIAGLWFGEKAASDQIFHELKGLIGEQGAKALQSVLAAANKPAAGLIATTVAVGTLFLGASGLFVELQSDLNAIWKVKPPASGGLWKFLRTRLVSFAMVLAIGFLLLVSLVLSAALTALGDYFGGEAARLQPLWHTINFLISFGVVTALFAMIFKFLPDTKIAWHDVWIGAAITSLLFNIGEFFIGMYLAKSSVASAYGAAGSVVILLLWVYYSSQILFFGAEFTHVYACEVGSHLNASQAKSQQEPSAASAHTLRGSNAAVTPIISPIGIPERIHARFTLKDVGLALLLASGWLFGWLWRTKQQKH